MTDIISNLIERRDGLKADLEAQLKGKPEGTRLTRTQDRAWGEVKELNVRIRELQEEEARAKRIEASARALSDKASKRSATRHVGYGTSTQTAGQIAPLVFAEAELRRMQGAALRGENCRIETRNSFSTADSLLPATLFPIPVAAQHEDRLRGDGFPWPRLCFLAHFPARVVVCAGQSRFIVVSRVGLSGLNRA
jgi:hypothetical protein